MGQSTSWMTRAKRLERELEAKQQAHQQDPRYQRAVRLGLLDEGQSVGKGTVSPRGAASSNYDQRLAETHLSNSETNADTNELQARQREEISDRTQETLKIGLRARRRRSSPRSLLAQNAGTKGILGAMGTLG